MYYLYEKTTGGNETIFKRLDSVSLSGCNFGVIVQYLRKILNKNMTEPIEWYISIDDLIKQLSLNGNCLVIDLKPNSEELLTLFQIVNIWGRSSSEWTPILLELKEILVDENPKNYNREKFSIPHYNNELSAFTLLYLKGTIKCGKIEGKWTFPGPSSTNSVLLWPETLEFFASKMGYTKK